MHHIEAGRARASAKGENQTTKPDRSKNNKLCIPTAYMLEHEQLITATTNFLQLRPHKHTLQMFVVLNAFL